jgi:hypothetical protein
MAQVVRVIKGDPSSVASQLNTIASTETINHIVKSYSAGEFLVISDDSISLSQTVTVVKGDPTSVATIAPAGSVLICPTFSAAQYLVIS